MINPPTVTCSLFREALEAGATGTVRLSDPDVPVTIYSEAVAKGTYTGTVTGTRTMSKVSVPPDVRLSGIMGGGHSAQFLTFFIVTLAFDFINYS